MQITYKRNIMRKKIYTIISLMLITTLSFGQEIMLSGIVKNAATLKGIKQAEIEAKGFSQYKTTTDATGFYFFMVPESSTTLIVKAKGMQMLEINLTKEIKKIGELNIFLDPKADDAMASMSMEELMNIEVAVATKKSTGIRETPGIITVITADQIQSSGARDMIDLIQRYVPGFAFASPISYGGVVGLGSRGIWSFDGKILILLDGMETNESRFGSVVFGNNYTLENIERIEIIRGPGSAVYGGYASMGVVNIITKQAKDGITGSASWLMAHTRKSFTHNNLSFNSQYANENLRIAFSGVYGNGTRSDKDYYDPRVNENRSMSRASELNVKEAGLQVGYKTFDFKCQVREYQMTSIDFWGPWSSAPNVLEFSDWLMQTSYGFKLGDYFTLTPKVNFKRQFPWQVNIPEVRYAQNQPAEDLKGDLILDFEKGIVNVTGGFAYDYQVLKQSTYNKNEEIFKGDSTRKWLIYNSMAAYLQTIVNTKFVNITAGARWDRSDLFGQALSPRIALTKAFEWFHLKAAYNQAFRAPGGILPNRVPANKELVAEKNQTIELEAGVKLPFGFYLTTNLYRVHVKDLITYLSGKGKIEGGYVNRGGQRASGIEASLQHKSPKLQAEINFAYYQRDEVEGDEHYLSPLDSKYFMAFAPLRLNASATWHITDRLFLTPSLSYFGERHYLSDYIEIYSGKKLVSVSFEYEKESPKILGNLYFGMNDVLLEGLHMGIGLNNILNTDFKFYPVNNKGPKGGITALDRNLEIKLTYQFTKRK